MPLYEYVGVNKRGREKKGIISAPTLGAAMDRLKNTGLFPIELRPVSSKQGIEEDGISLLPKRFFSKLPMMEFVYSMRHLSTLISSGLPLDMSLSSVSTHIKNDYLKKCFLKILEDIRGGLSFARAASSHPRLFSPSIIVMIEAGESSGSLDIVLEEIANLLENSAEFKRKITTSLAYPIFILIVGILVVIFLFSFVVPKITVIFSELKQELPLPTKILLCISSFVRVYWPFMLIIGIILIFAFKFLYKQQKVKRYLDSILLSMWVIGDIYKKIILSRFSSMLGMLLKNGITLVNGMQIVKGISGNLIFREVIDKATKNIIEGKSLKDSLEKSNIFPTFVLQMISAGEDSGRLDEILIKVGTSLEREINSRLSVLTSLLEPVLILALGSVVGFVVVSTLLPIFEMSQLVK